MAFVILSTGGVAGSKLHTMRLGSLVLASAAGLAVALLLGVALGLFLGRLSPAGIEAASPQLATSGSQRIVLQRVGALHARLVRLESEAVNLARQVDLAEPEPSSNDGTPSPGSAGEPSGGPLVAPLDTDRRFGPTLASLARDVDRLDALFAMIVEAATVRSLAQMAFPSRTPVAGGALSSGFGNRRDPFTRRLARHTGIDIRAPRGAPILASAGGRVTFAGYRGAYGKMVEIDHGNGLTTRYGHAAKLYVRRGEIVLPHQRIGAVGSTGRSTGPHLHFEVLRRGAQVEPRLYLARGESS